MPQPWLDVHRSAREGWSQQDALSLKKELQKKGIEAPPWFLGSPRAAQKLSQKHPKGQQLLATTDLAEMASRREVAQQRYTAIQDVLPYLNSAEFPACGAGLDILHFHDFLETSGVEKSIPFLAGDLNHLHSALAQENLNILKVKASIYSYDALKPAHTWPPCPNGRYLFLDPARREGQQKLERHTYLPRLEDSLALLESYGCAQIKLAPGESPETLQAFAEKGWSWQWIQWGKDLLECFGTWISEDFRQKHGLQPRPRWSICRFHHGVSHIWPNLEPLHKDQREEINELQPEETTILHQPCKALRHSQLDTDWAHDHQLHLAEYMGLWEGTALSAIHDELCDSFLLLDQFPAQAKKLKGKLKPHQPAYFELRAEGVKPKPEFLQKLKPFLQAPKGPSGQIPKLYLLLCLREDKETCLILKDVCP